MKILGIALMAATLSAAAYAEEPAAASGGKIYAQALVDGAIARHPELTVMALHVTPPKSEKNVIIASNIGRIGKEGDAEDLAVVKTGKPHYVVDRDHAKYEAELPLLDANRRIVGALGLVFPYQPGDDQAKLAKRAEEIRDDLARHISHVGNLMEAASFDPNIPANSLAQSLVDEALAAHKKIVILALHVPAPGNAEYPIIASNIGRLGKKADEDDMHVITTGESKLEFNDTGDRFEVEHPLRDKSGATIGAVGVVFAYRKGVDEKVLKKEADAVQAWLQSHIPSAAALLQPAK